MKTKNNIQKTGFGLVKKSVIGGFAILFCSVLINSTVSAGDSKQQSLSNSNCCILTVDMTKMEASQIEDGINFLEYNAQDFADAEMESESETNLDINAETNHALIEAELSVQVEAYLVNDFAEAELTTETENFMNSYSDATEAELTLQVEAYNANDFVEAELAVETENFMTSNSDASETEFSFQVEEYNAQDFADTEMALEIESWMIFDNSFTTPIEFEKFAQNK